MKFEELNIKQEIKDNIKQIGYEKLTEVQEKALDFALNGNDLFVRSQTGSGKTMAFAIPLVNNLTPNKGIEALVVCPTRELAMQVSKEIKKLVSQENQNQVVAVYGGADMVRQIKALKQGAKIVVGTPGRIIDHINRHSLKLHTIKTVVLDEADEMLNMGFIADIESILKATPKIKQTMLFSATYPENIKKLAKNYLIDAKNIEIGIENQSLSNIQQEYAIIKKQNKKQALLEILNSRMPFTSIVFCNTKDMSSEVASFLRKNKILAQALNGDMSQFERNRVMQNVQDGKTAVLVATDVASRGIDINDVDYVFNFDMPKTTEYFLHRIGRTARAGKNGHAVTLISTENDMQLLKNVEQQTYSTIDKLDMGELNFYFYNTKPKKYNTKNYGKEKSQRISERFGGVFDRIGQYTNAQGLKKTSHKNKCKSTKKRDF